MKLFKNHIDYIFVSLLILAVFLPEFGVIDITDIQFFYLTITQSLIFTYLFFYEKDKDLISKLGGNKILIAYQSFILICGISIISSFNTVEAIKEFLRYFIIFIAIVNYSYILYKREDKLRFLLIFLILFLSVEAIYVLKVFYNNYNYESGLSRIRKLQGFSYNQNITAFSLVIKIPLLILLILKSKSKLLNILGIIIFAIALFDVLIIGSRGGIISFLFVFAFSSLFCFFVFKREKLFIKKTIILTIITGIIFILQSLLYTNKSDLKAITRIALLEDSSTSYRLDNFSEAIQGIIDKPLLGFGIGNWKIISIKYAKDRIKQYEMPLHVHNDFLHIGTETGILGMIIYISIFYFVGLLLFKEYRKNKRMGLIAFFFLLSIIVYLLDSSLNFPRARVYSQVNLILILSYIVSTTTSKFQSRNNLALLMRYFLILIMPFGIYFGYKVFKSSIIQKKIIYDFNTNSSNYLVPIEEILEMDPAIPNISNVCFPLKSSLAFYQIQEGDYTNAKKNAIDANKYNPFLGLMEHQLSKIYLESKSERNIDSAYKYAKIAHDKLPNNSSHNSTLQYILAELNKLEESKALFIKIKKVRNEVIWQNYILFSTLSKFNGEFDDFDKKTIKEALVLFPENKILNQCDKMINYGAEPISIANQFDKDAIRAFENKNYESAIKNWESAAKVITTDDSYLLNITQALLKMKKNQQAFEQLEEIKEKKLVGKDGKYEYLWGIYYLATQKKLKACEYFNKGINLGSKDAVFASKSLGCARFNL